ncbi:MAG: aromatic ring-hydroxylating dioxygenase subunit alpha [Pseudomonadales bacterium]|nr:aromatic ring-hydroxylating dioxygenase subunit alpha [Pseudomonadales bacterium]
MSSSIIATDLVRHKEGKIARDIFVSPEVYQRELKQVFGRSWLLVGHESQIPNKYDYFVSRMGEESVIMTRDKTNKIHVFLNTCPHRGMKVCRYDQGNARVFTCPYHAWSFSVDGNKNAPPGGLVGVPHFKKAYQGGLDKSKWGLVPVAQLVNYKGSIWANWDKNAVDFETYLGDMKIYLDAVLDHRDGTPGGSEVIGGIQKWKVPSNWKFGAENFIGDLYHITSHRSVDMVSIGPSGAGRRDTIKLDDEAEKHIIRKPPPRMGSIGFPNHGHGLIGTQPHYAEPDYAASFTLTPIVEEYYKEIYHRRVENLGKQSRVLTPVGTIFPNCSFHGMQPRALFTWHPNGAQEMEMWKWYLVDADAPDEVKNVLRQYYLRYAGPAGLTEQDDMENWNYATSASSGARAGLYPYNYQMGLGFESQATDIKDAIFTASVTEQNQRLFYNRWAEFMDADSWDNLHPDASNNFHDILARSQS